jgi:DNA-binding response OmpR family regulator
MKRREKILIVDDDAVQLKIVSAWLLVEGYGVLTLDSPFGVGRAVIREQPDALLLDIGMPALEGTSIADALRQNVKAHRTAIIFYSGREPAALQELAWQHGALGWIQKTPDGTRFLAELRRILSLWNS